MRLAPIPSACAVVSLFAALHFLVLAPRVSADSATTAAPQRERVIFGALLPEKNAPVVAVTMNKGKESGLCTGSIISPTAVLTAWHCVSRRPQDMKVFINGKFVAVRSVRTDPHVHTDRKTKELFDDVAILHLRRPVTIRPLAILASRSVEPGDLLAIFGYGLDETGQAGALRGGFTAVDAVNSNIVSTVFQLPESDACSGDSGGPAMFLFQAPDGSQVSAIVGTTSTGTSAHCLPGDVTAFINLQSPTVIAFILSQVPNARLV
jgi:secreted trypsin-like serine protease